MYISIIEPVGGHGGMDYYDYGLAYGLNENNVTVLFYTSDKTNVRNYKNVQTKLVFKGVWGAPFLKKTFLYIIGHLRAYIDSKKNGAKIVHLHFFFFRSIDLLLLWFAKLFGFKIIVTVHDINSFHKSSNSAIEKWCYKLIDGVIIHNQASYDVIKAKNLKIKNIAIIPHGNYLPFISPLTSGEKSSSMFNILFFGQIKHVKGVDILLNAVSLVVKQKKDVQLVIAGKAWKSDLATYENIIAELGLEPFVKTDFRYIPDEEVASFFAKADLIVLPYREIYQSGVLLLAMSYGKPILCSDLIPFTEVLEDKQTGFIFKSEDYNDMAAKILEITHNPELLNYVSSNASGLIEKNYNWVDIGKKTVDFYHLISN